MPEIAPFGFADAITMTRCCQRREDFAVLIFPVCRFADDIDRHRVGQIAIATSTLFGDDAIAAPATARRISDAEASCRVYCGDSASRSVFRTTPAS